MPTYYDTKIAAQTKQKQFNNFNEFNNPMIQEGIIG